MRSTVFIVLLGLIGQALAEQPDCSAMPLLEVPNAQGQSYASYVSQEKMAHTEQWSPGLGTPPPLDMLKAAALVEQQARAKSSEYDRIVINAISLRAYNCPNVSARWYYIVEYAPVINGEKKMEKYSMTTILMDGTVIEPRLKTK